MTTETISNTYENGKRIEVQKNTYDKSDDLYTLANLQRRYESVCKQIAAAKEGENIQGLLVEKAKFEADISAQKEKLGGYENENE